MKNQFKIILPPNLIDFVGVYLIKIETTHPINTNPIFGANLVSLAFQETSKGFLTKFAIHRAADYNILKTPLGQIILRPKSEIHLSFNMDVKGRVLGFEVFGEDRVNSLFVFGLDLLSELAEVSNNESK